MNAIPQLIAHRGYVRRYPENTLEGLAAALNLGARYLELDVQLTRDGIPVLFHDADLRRTTGAPGSLLDLTWDRARHLPAGEPVRLGDAFAHVRIPRLTDLAALLSSWPDARALVELKVESLKRHGVKRVVQCVLDELAPVIDRCMVISFVEEAVRAAHQHVACGWVIERWDAAVRRHAHALGPELLIGDHRRLPDGNAGFWRGAWRWALYEVERPELALVLANRGADFIETFDIGGMLEHPALRSASGG